MAWYTTPSWLQAPGSGQFWTLFFWQLHSGGALTVLTFEFLVLFDYVCICKIAKYQTVNQKLKDAENADI